MTPTIELICGHRSIRHFTDEPISEAQREAIINSARATSSSFFESSYSSGAQSQRDIMSHQLTFADSEFSTKRRQTRKEIFLSRMEQILPWQNIDRCHRAVLSQGRAMADGPYPLETMLRIHCMQHWVQPERRCHGRCPVPKSPPCACLPDYPWIAPCRIAPPS